MTQESPYAKLVKIQNRSAVEIVRLGKLKFPIKIETKPDAPCSGMIEELVAQNLLVDALKVLALALPGREAVWWGCLAARDLAEEGSKRKALAAVETWVFKPDLANKEKLKRYFSEPGGGVPAKLCRAAWCVPMPDDAEPPMAPPNLVGLLSFTAQVKSFYAPDDPQEIALRGEMLLARGLDIARGGSGQINPPAPPDTTAPQVPEQV